MQIAWKTFNLVCVDYIDGDLFSKLLAISSLIPIFIIFGSITLIFFRRYMHTITFFIGILLNTAIGYSIKKFIKSPRPIRDNQIVLSYGMPSSHAQFIWFFIVYMNVSNYIVDLEGHYFKKVTEFLFPFALTIMAIIVSFSRIYLLYHTTPQVIIGSILGVIFGFAWYQIYDHTKHYYKKIVKHHVCQTFMIKDCTDIPNLLIYEHKKLQKLSS